MGEGPGPYISACFIKSWESPTRRRAFAPSEWGILNPAMSAPYSAMLLVASNCSWNAYGWGPYGVSKEMSIPRLQIVLLARFP